MTRTLPRFYYPFPSKTHPDDDRAERELIAWLSEYNLLSDPKWEERIRRASFGELIGRAIPDATCEGLLAATLWCGWIFSVDDGICSEAGLRSMPGDVATVHLWLREIMKDPSRYGPPTECELNTRFPAMEAFVRSLQFSTADMCMRIADLSTPAQYGRWCAEMLTYFLGTLWETVTQPTGGAATVRDVMRGRRASSGAYSIYGFLDSAAGYELPASEYYDPNLTRLSRISADVLGIANDVLSYGIENALNDDSLNVVTALIREHGLTVQQALDSAVRIHNDKVAESITLSEKISGYASEELARFTQQIPPVMRGNYDWCLTTDRYHVNDYYDLSNALKVGEQSAREE